MLGGAPQFIDTAGEGKVYGSQPGASARSNVDGPHQVRPELCECPLYPAIAAVLSWFPGKACGLPS